MGAAPDPMVTSFYLFREDGLNFERNYLDEDAVVNCLVNYYPFLEFIKDFR